MGNCALKPKVLSEAGVPAPEELNDSLLEDQKIDAAKSLSNLFLQDKAEKIAPENMPVIEDLKIALVEERSPTKEPKSPATETRCPVAETKPPVDDEKVRNEEAARGEKVIDDVTVKETETEAKPEEVGREAAQ